jgi:CCR4-NOT transcription complex subunit 7/8
MRCNVDLLKIIQVGITLANEEGEFHQECSTWQFNFKFNLACVFELNGVVVSSDVSSNREDMFTPDSVEQLQKAGIDFQRHEEYGILPNDFAELMITSGMVLSQDTHWISFHRSVEFHFHSKLPYNQPNGSCPEIWAIFGLSLDPLSVGLNYVC